MNLVDTVGRRLRELGAPVSGCVLVGVSGGADSVALAVSLAALCRRAGGRCVWAHLDHGLRGRAARADAAFVARLARGTGVACLRGEADVSALARRWKVSAEMAARRARMDFLTAAARSTGADWLALAHHADDQAETVLLRLARGSGVRGVAAIRADADWKGLRVVRPLLAVRRAEIERFLRDRGLSWREDRTNRDGDILRNRVRRRVLPYLERTLNPDIRTALRRFAEIAAGEDAWLSEQAAACLAAARRGCGAAVLNVGPLARAHVALARRALVSWLFENGVPAAAVGFDLVERLLGLLGPEKSEGRIALPGGVSVERRGRRLRLVRDSRPRPWRPVRWPLPGRVDIPELGLRFTAVADRGFEVRRESGPGRWPAEAWIRRDAAVGALHIRRWRPGDSYEPYGTGGRRKLQDIFTDAGVPRERRLRLPVVWEDRHVAWLPGYRIARSGSVPSPRAPSWRLRVEILRDVRGG